MIVEKLLREEWSNNEYQKVFDVSIPKFESVNTNQLKHEIKYFVSKQVNEKNIVVKPICWQNNKPTIVVNLSNNKFLFVIDK